MLRPLWCFYLVLANRFFAELVYIKFVEVLGGVKTVDTIAVINVIGVSGIKTQQVKSYCI